jgi:hypothetical protein
MKHSATALFLILTANPAMARESLGTFEGWGAFRDSNPEHCFAITEPVRESEGKWRPFASISHWPTRALRGQLHIRLSKEHRAGADVIMTIDDRRWRLVAGKFDVWAPTPRHDAFILAKIRSGKSMSIATIAANGRGFADTYRLRGAATAIDAAALGCAGRR